VRRRSSTPNCSSSRGVPTFRFRATRCSLAGWPRRGLPGAPPAPPFRDRWSGVVRTTTTPNLSEIPGARVPEQDAAEATSAPVPDASGDPAATPTPDPNTPDTAASADGDTLTLTDS